MLTSSFDLFANFRRRSLNKVCSCFHKRGKYDIVRESDCRYCTGASQEINVLYSSCQGGKAATAGFPPLPKNYTRPATRGGAGR